MSVILAKSAGFCYGVKRAVDLAKKAAEETGGCWMLGDLIHNTHVVEELAALGIRKTADISTLGEGDTVVIESLSRLGRSTKNLAELMETFNNKNIRLVSLKETIDTTTPTGKLLYTILSSLAQFERDILVERTNEGLKAARARGRGGGRPKTDVKAIQKALALYHTSLDNQGISHHTD